MSELFSVLVRFGRRTSILAAVVTGTLSGLAGTAILAVINRLMNLDDPHLGQPWLPWAFLGLCLGMPAFRVVATYLLYSLGVRAARDLRLELSRKILGAPLRQLEEVGAQRLLVALHRDVGVLADTVTSIPALSINIALVAGSLGYLGWLSPFLLLLILGLIVLGVISYQLPILAAQRRESSAHEHHQRIYQHFEDLTGGMKELKMHSTRRGAFLGQLEATAERLRRA